MSCAFVGEYLSKTHEVITERVAEHVFCKWGQATSDGDKSAGNKSTRRYTDLEFRGLVRCEVGFAGQIRLHNKNTTEVLKECVYTEWVFGGKRVPALEIAKSTGSQGDLPREIGQGECRVQPSTGILSYTRLPVSAMPTTKIHGIMLEAAKKLDPTWCT